MTKNSIVYRRLMPFTAALKVGGTNIENITEYTVTGIPYDYNVKTRMGDLPLPLDLETDRIKNFCIENNITLYRDEEDYEAGKYHEISIIHQSTGRNRPRQRS